MRSSNIQTRVIFEDSGLENGFYDASWNAWVSPLNSTRSKGMQGGAAVCGTIRNGVGVVAAGAQCRCSVAG
jgi:hypothetical protein